MSSGVLKEAGVKVTLPRLKILALLKQGVQKYVTAEDIHKALEVQGDVMGLATVYRTLTEFERVGIVRRLNFENTPSVFELDTGDNHSHLVCSTSGKVEGFTDPIIEERIREVVKAKGFKLANHSLVIYGTFEE